MNVIFNRCAYFMKGYMVNMKKTWLFVMATFSVAICGEVSRDNIVLSGLNPIAANRPGETWSQDYIKVYMNSAPWATSNSTCGTDRFLVKKTDVAMVTTLLTAWSTGSKLLVSVDDGYGIPVIQPSGDKWCTAVSVYMHN